MISTVDTVCTLCSLIIVSRRCMEPSPDPCVLFIIVHNNFISLLNNKRTCFSEEG